MKKFVVFPGRGKAYFVERVKVPKISILRSGEFSINKICREQLLNGYKYVILGFDKDNKQIGFKGTNQKSDETYPLRPIKGGDFFLVSGQGFLNWCSVFDPKMPKKARYFFLSRKYSAKKQGDWVMIQLKRPYTSQKSMLEHKEKLWHENE